MVSKTVDTILGAEMQAEIKAETARKEAARIILEAREKADEIIKTAEFDGDKEAVRLLKSNKTDIDEIFRKNSELCQKETAEIKEKSKAKKEKAINIVISKIIGK